MRCLLDTHAVIWAVNEPEKLGEPARELIEDASTDVLVSAVSGWELATKHRLGKLPEAAGFLASYESNLRRLGAIQLSITTAHALLAGDLDWEHRDPFDRMLAAQAILESLTLVTRDPVLAARPNLRTVW